MKGLMSNKNLLISSLIDHSSKYHGNTEIVYKDVNGEVARKNYNEVNKRIRKLASSLQKLNVQIGDRIATMAWSNLRHFELYYAVSGIGAICHTINPRLFKEQLVFIINDAENKLIFVDIDFLDLLKEIENQLPLVQSIIVLCKKEQMPEIRSFKKNIFCYEDLIATEKELENWPSFDEETASSLCYTSGTTGNPKGVLYSHRSTILHTLAAANPDALNISGLDVIMPVAPMFHANAWGIPYVATMVGAKIVLPGRYLDGESVYNFIEEEEVTFSAAVPTVWLMLFDYLEKNKRNLKSLKRCVIGGSACPKFMIKDFKEKYDVEVIHAWGMTETSPLGTVNRPLKKHLNYSTEQKYNLAIKQGRPIYGVEIKITDDEEKLLPNDGKAFGNLWVKGPWICSGYLNIINSETHKDDGWFLTGDVATIDSDGFMQITDRVKDVIKSGGEWISSIEVENIAMGHQKVAEAAVIGAIHSKWDERPLLLVVKEGNVEKQEIMDYLSDKIVKWWMPDDLIFVDSLPHTATGKVRKVELKDKYKNYLINKK